MRTLTAEEISRRVKYSVVERKYLIFAEDGATIIGRSLLKESAMAMLRAYHIARAVLARKGVVSEYRFQSAIHGDIPLWSDGLSAGQRKASDASEEGRRRMGLVSVSPEIIQHSKDYKEK